MIRVLLDHTCVQALAEGAEFLDGLYVEAGSGRAELVVPALSAAAAEREKQGTGRHVLQRRFITVEDFTHDHALMGAAWAHMDWRILHPAASVILAERAGINATLLSLNPHEYIGTGVNTLNPQERRRAFSAGPMLPRRPQPLPRGPVGSVPPETCFCHASLFVSEQRLESEYCCARGHLSLEAVPVRHG